MSILSTPSNREYIPRIVTTPVVECSSPSIELYVDLIAIHCTHSGGADQMGVLSVHRLKLHSQSKLVVLGGGGLLADSMDNA